VVQEQNRRLIWPSFCDVACAAAAAASAKPFPDNVMGALKKYGDHAKAAYVFFESKKEAVIKGQAMQDIVER
jgi:hypothetical protein